MYPATQRLEAAYRATAYVIRCGGRSVVLRIGAAPAALRWAVCRQACVVTAFNPRSRLRSDAANLRAARRLKHSLRRQGLRFAPSLACSDEGACGETPAWPPEPGLLVFGTDRRRSAALGRIWRQNAVVLVNHHDVVLVALA